MTILIQPFPLGRECSIGLYPSTSETHQRWDSLLHNTESLIRLMLMLDMDKNKMNSNDYEKFAKMMQSRLLENKSAEVVTLYLNIFSLYASCFMLNIFKSESTTAYDTIEMLIKIWINTLEEKIGQELDVHDNMLNSPFRDILYKNIPTSTEAHQEFDDALYKAEQIIRDVLQMKQKDTDSGV